MRTYPSKLLLFGEHILLQGGSALAIPLHRFSGFWQPEGTPLPAEIMAKLRLFANSTHLDSIDHLDAGRFASELELGLSLQSDIPVGYGLGSSGALCAAVYDRYCTSKTDDLAELKLIFSGMESFFHGSSSGIDPLTSYLDKPLLIRNKTDVFAAEQKNW
ncbi:MAG: mevalonate kinase, partial [Bacteroidota bacterium]